MMSKVNTLADQNRLTFKYERTMYSASYQSAERGYFVHSYIQITFPGSSPVYQTPCETSQSKNFFNSFFRRTTPLVEEAKELASNVLAASLLVVHDTGGGGQDDVTELTRRKELSSPLLEVTELDGVAGVDDTTLVETEDVS
jgi:hypothetical protein